MAQHALAIVYNPTVIGIDISIYRKLGERDLNQRIKLSEKSTMTSVMKQKLLFKIPTDPDTRVMGIPLNVLLLPTSNPYKYNCLHIQ